MSKESFVFNLVQGGRRCWPVLLGLLICSQALAAELTNIYRTGFEAVEGYDLAFPLEGQQGWLGGGEESYQGENGLTNGVLPGLGQQAFIGGSLAATGTNYYYTWQPIGLAPIPPEFRRVLISVRFSITESTNDLWDNFYWTIYNTEGTRLLSFDFDNYYSDVAYWLENAEDASFPEVAFVNDQMYQLQLWLDFAHNRWHALLDDTLLATNQPITTTNSALNLGDVEAGWGVFEVGSPGNNRMFFDELEVRGEFFPAPPRFRSFSKSPAGNFEAQVTGAQPGWNYAIDFTRDFANWTSVATNTANPDGTFDFVDRTTSGTDHRFYRTRLLP